MLNIRVKKLDPEMKDPQYAHLGDAGFDFFAREKVVIGPGEIKAIPTGISMAIPEGYVGLIWDKSGLSIKNGLKTMGGVIDAGYRGEILIGVINLSEKEYIFEKNHKVAQMLIQKIEQATFEMTNELDATTRGEGGFGSTGK